MSELGKDPSTEANGIFTDLVATATFPSALVDVSTTEFALPATEGNPLHDAPNPITLESLTEKEVDGNGAFDVIMASLGKHLEVEFDTGRITGREYAEAYTQAALGALSTAVQYVLGKDATTYQNALIQMQARAAEVAAVTAKAQLVEQRQRTIAAQAEALTAQTNYALGKMRLATEDITYSKIEADTKLTCVQVEIAEVEKDTADYRLASILPEERRQLTYQTDHVLRSQVDKTDFEVGTIMPKQATVLDKDISIKNYHRTNLIAGLYKLSHIRKTLAIRALSFGLTVGLPRSLLMRVFWLRTSLRTIRSMRSCKY